MRINDKTVPALAWLFNPNTNNLKYFENGNESLRSVIRHPRSYDDPSEFTLWDMIVEDMEFRSMFFKQAVFVVSKSFFDATRVAGNKLDAAIKSDLTQSQELDLGFTLIYDNLVFMVHYQAFNSDDYIEHNFGFSVVSKTGYVLINGVQYQGYGDKGQQVPPKKKIWIDHRTRKEHNFSDEEILATYLNQALRIYFFKKYANVETKELPPFTMAKIMGCKYLNETRLPITYLDSKWFTTLIKSDGFKVRGHFRFQPKKKDGEWTKELIWIEDFMKTGYTAPARMLNETISHPPSPLSSSPTD